MDALVDVSQRDNFCPLLCITKAVLFATITAFVLYLPLGDPQVHCDSIAASPNNQIPFCYLCEAYFVLLKVTNQIVEILEFVACVILDILYEAKLKFYTMLERIDKRDLCSSVCCTKAEDEKNLENTKETRCPLCKCVKSKCKSKHVS